MKMNFEIKNGEMKYNIFSAYDKLPDSEYNPVKTNCNTKRLYQLIGIQKRVKNVNN